MKPVEVTTPALAGDLCFHIPISSFHGNQAAQAWHEMRSSARLLFQERHSSTNRNNTGSGPSMAIVMNLSQPEGGKTNIDQV